MVGDDAQISDATTQSVNDRFAWHFLYVHIKVRGLRKELANCARKGLGHCGRVAKQSNGPAQSMTKARHIHMQGFELSQHAVGVAKQSASSIGGDDP